MEVYRNLAGQILKVSKARNTRIVAKCRKETKGFENYKQFAVHLYNKGFHIAMTDRLTLLASRYQETEDFLKFTDLILDNELAFQKDGAIYTCWFLGFKPNGMVEVKSNTDFSYTNELGYKAATVRLDELIIIKGDI